MSFSLQNGTAVLMVISMMFFSVEPTACHRTGERKGVQRRPCVQQRSRRAVLFVG